MATPITLNSNADGASTANNFIGRFKDIVNMIREADGTMTWSAEQ